MRAGVPDGDCFLVGVLIPAELVEPADFFAQTDLQCLGHAQERRFDGRFLVLVGQVVRPQMILFLNLRQQHLVDDSGVDVTAAETMVARYGQRRDVEAFPGLRQMDAEHGDIAGPPAEVKHQQIATLPRFAEAFQPVRETIVEEGGNRFVHQVAADQFQASEPGRFSGVAALGGLEGRRHGDHHAVKGPAILGFDRIHHEAEDKAADLSCRAEPLRRPVIGAL